MKAFIKIDALSRITPSRPSSIRAERFPLLGSPDPNRIPSAAGLSAAVLVGAIALTVTVLRVWLVT